MSLLSPDCGKIRVMELSLLHRNTKHGVSHCRTAFLSPECSQHASCVISSSGAKAGPAGRISESSRWSSSLNFGAAAVALPFGILEELFWVDSAPIEEDFRSVAPVSTLPGVGGE